MIFFYHFFFQIFAGVKKWLTFATLLKEQREIAKWYNILNKQFYEGK
ncbi:hypothetical protein HMPREF1536_03120 [Parabacteroides gordonii MS-1 = DSM 23371]|uniref:Uncharacterized protein n=1 Tax=Parabacteroides gordonii MS-1 = DSM 23371 TaxID=1203610 RepID=A0A0F5JD60_9BACT|nr:hypothetical protein HMPREF1536_03120 [Parabacteroides gordonii MS-1 = DSM 23371]